MLSQLIAYLGQPEKKVNSEHIWQCPICRDSGRDNLKYNEVKNVITCFADPDHSREILKQSGKEKYKQDGVIMERKETTKREIDKSWFADYMLECQNELLDDPKALAFLEGKRGITKSTASFCGIGFDRKKKRWVFPIFSLDANLEGFEYRPPNIEKFSDGSKCKKEIGTPSILAAINGYTPEKEVLVIVEGFIDGYVFLQHQVDKDLDSRVQVATPSNGVNSLLSSIQKAPVVERYSEVILLLDNDEAGITAEEKILKEYPAFKSQKFQCGCKDFNEHYLKCIKKREEQNV